MFCERNSENLYISLHFQEKETATLPSDTCTNQHAKVRKSRSLLSGFTSMFKKKNRTSAGSSTDDELADDPGSDSPRRRERNDPLPDPEAPATATYDSTFPILPTPTSPPLPLRKHHNTMVSHLPRSASSFNIGADHGDDAVFSESKQVCSFPTPPPPGSFFGISPSSAPSVIGRVEPIPTRVTTNTVRNHHHTIEF